MGLKIKAQDVSLEGKSGWEVRIEDQIIRCSVDDNRYLIFYDEILISTRNLYIKLSVEIKSGGNPYKEFYDAVQLKDKTVMFYKILVLAKLIVIDGITMTLGE